MGYQGHGLGYKAMTFIQRLSAGVHHLLFRCSGYGHLPGHALKIIVMCLLFPTGWGSRNSRTISRSS